MGACVEQISASSEKEGSTWVLSAPALAEGHQVLNVVHRDLPRRAQLLARGELERIVVEAALVVPQFCLAVITFVLALAHLLVDAILLPRP